ncbi:MAG: hypothetical protein Q7O66_16655 [Dehalococcoidia bacterium]|nr:hypothetical protein [Dehalococcoidia bacterium]
MPLTNPIPSGVVGMSTAGTETAATEQAQPFGTNGIACDLITEYTSGGGFVLRPKANSTTALKLANAGSTAILTVDTTNARIGLNTTPSGTFHVVATNLYTLFDYSTVADSGMRGWRIDKTAATAQPHGIVWTIDGAPKWDVGMDFENTDMVLAYSHADTADQIRIGPLGQMVVGRSVGDVTLYAKKFNVDLDGNTANVVGIGPGIDCGPYSPGNDTVYHIFRAYAKNTNWPVSISSIYDANSADQYIVLNGHIDGGTKAATTINSPVTTGRFIRTLTSADNSTNSLDIGRAGIGAGQTPTVDLSFDKNGDITLSDAIDIAVGSSTGTKLGTAASQKLGFWGHAPVIQPAKASYNNWAAFGDVVNALVACGIFDAA